MSDPAANKLRKLSPTEREEQLFGAAADIIKKEREHIAGPDHETVEWWGIGLSGGGIRSASLALGVLQSLAEHDLLRRFHFISTVSGGGYLGSSLQWWWSQGRLAAKKPTDAPRPELQTSETSKTQTPRDLLYYISIVLGNLRSSLPRWRSQGQPQASVASKPAKTPSDPPSPELLTCSAPKVETPANPTPPQNAEALKPNDDDPRFYGTRPHDFPYGLAHPSRQGGAQAASLDPKPELILSFLRAHSSYLIPGHGLTMWSMVGVLLRTITIAIATWLPLLTLAMGGLFLLDHFLEIGAKALSLQSPFGNAMPVAWRDFFEKVPPELEVFRYRAIFAVLLLLSYILACTFISAAIVFSLLSRAPQDPTTPRTRTGAVISCLAVLALFFSTFVTFNSLDASMIFVLMTATIFAVVLALTLVADLRTDPNLSPSYMLRRWLETTIGRLLPITVVLLALGTIPFAPYYIAKHTGGGTFTGIFSVAAGVASALYGYYTFLRNIIPGVVGQITATAGAIIYLYATIVFAYILILMLIHPQSFANDTISKCLQIGIPLSMLIAVAIATWSNINFVGLHRFYRDRLMEAFMPTTTSVKAMTTMTSPVADSLSVAALADLSKYNPKSGSGLPYPIINANVILSNDPHQKYASRGGDNFIITPLYVGSTATGWQPTEHYLAMNGPLTLPSAMAASGAAASASAGYIGTGITTNPFVSAVMSLLNIRLGLWIGNPMFESSTKRYNIPTFLNPGLWSGVLQQGHTYDSGYLELTDGGHFENLALYELVRRRTKVILIVDGEADPQMGLSSLVSATRRIEEDFGARLEFADGMGPPRLMMYPQRGDDPRYPSDARYAAAPFIIGKLTYDHATEKDGILIYVKSTLIQQMDFKTAGYLALNPDFPHQSTVDQFFNSAQFDAYRCLGYESAEFALSALKGSPALNDYPNLQNALATSKAGTASPPPKITLPPNID
jgi:hypothetical protein